MKNEKITQPTEMDIAFTAKERDLKQKLLDLELTLLTSDGIEYDTTTKELISTQQQLVDSLRQREQTLNEKAHADIDDFNMLVHSPTTPETGAQVGFVFKKATESVSNYSRVSGYTFGVMSNLRDNMFILGEGSPEEYDFLDDNMINQGLQEEQIDIRRRILDLKQKLQLAPTLGDKVDICRQLSDLHLDQLENTSTSLAQSIERFKDIGDVVKVYEMIQEMTYYEGWTSYLEDSVYQYDWLISKLISKQGKQSELPDNQK